MREVIPMQLHRLPEEGEEHVLVSFVHPDHEDDPRWSLDIDRVVWDRMNQPKVLYLIGGK